jgi:hypothetical protein
MVAARHRAMMTAIAAEYYAVMGRPEPALQYLEQGAKLPFIDLLWIDKCPALDRIRAEPRFAAARALVAARVSELWA